ncbi:dephospho-CoA kinase [Campylobacter upsaliensis]|uniref:Dephospho-CoA kinase n=1 Tax=Campylobacter upsaliensis JV21 TaxID=888826 RepID=A0A828QXI4_CAMUP|nr:dephospho-CoA kinase [Campylobacter upsaliensis]EAB5281838.1 dephospho-CoA kinase [Campylobacter upsaliensis]EAH6228576.1 dephospho-CoA kinase [Campylobacter upsaliensis]EAH7702312.1 dephospho-CoA kinase [Campylobacter upsaliensis]EAH8309200.1 dephospho-CoA kinase [Campylobacter upsaliensis]EAH9135967.1 dephospho-CoA kinase [Campylobacter upsaliensis]
MKYAYFVSASIACGKSSFIKIANELGFESLSADLIANEITQKNAAVLAEIFLLNLDKEGKIDKKVLANLIFKNKKAKEKLENFMHPKIREELLRKMQILEQKGRIFFVELPLFFESDFYQNLGKSVLIYAPKNVSLQRLMQRDGLDKDEALRRIKSQMDIEKKREMADFVIENIGSYEEFRQNCVKFIKSLKE